MAPREMGTHVLGVVSNIFDQPQAHAVWWTNGWNCPRRVYVLHQAELQNVKILRDCVALKNLIFIVLNLS